MQGSSRKSAWLSVKTLEPPGKASFMLMTQSLETKGSCGDVTFRYRRQNHIHSNLMLRAECPLALVARAHGPTDQMDFETLMFTWLLGPA